MKEKIIVIRNIISILWKRHHFLIPPKYLKKYLVSFYRKLTKNYSYLNPFIILDYNNWLLYKKEEKKDLNFLYNPLISFIIPVYNIEPSYLKDCLDSILNQSYKNLEICLADDCSTKVETLECLKQYEAKDSRVKVVFRKTNGHISEATNSALEIASGEYIALMDDDDILDKDALYKVVEVINKDKMIDMIYSDEDKLDMEGNYCEPHFKPDYSRESLYGGNYICHFTIIKKTLFDKIGNFDQEYVGAQDFDLFLRATEQANEVYHIPEILYHWRKVPGSTADTIENKEYAILNGKRAVEAALLRRNLDAYVTIPIKCTHYVVHYNVKKEPLVSIIMLDNHQNSIKNNLKEIFEKTDYKNIEVIIDSKKEIELEESLLKNVNFIHNDNINSLINHSKGDYILIISGEIKVNNREWILELVGYASQKEIGVVGPKIHNFDKTIKSAGLIVSNKNIYIDAFSNYFIDSPGMYGRLLVPYNYSALSSDCIMFSKKKYIQVDCFLEDVCYDVANIDFCLKMLKNNYRNVLLSHISIRQKDIHKKSIYEISDKEKNRIRDLHNLDKDLYYNDNNSKDYPFMLDKK